MKTVLTIIFLISNAVFSQDLRTHEVYFDTDKYDLPVTEENRLLLFITELDSLPINKISIYGFCDDRGTDKYNLKLSQQRADAIKNIFTSYQIKDSLITNVDGKGEILLKLVKEIDLHKIRGLNRKVEIEVSLAKKNIKEEKSAEKKPKDAVLKTKDLLEGNAVEVGDKIRFDNILFETNYSFVSRESKKKLEKIAKVLKQREGIYFTIQGHVCCTQNARDAIDKKTRKRNLSVARAKYIYDYLAKKGISKRRMKYAGLRRKFPLGGDEKYDRRVEILITYIAEDK